MGQFASRAAALVSTRVSAAAACQRMRSLAKMRDPVSALADPYVSACCSSWHEPEICASCSFVSAKSRRSRSSSTSADGSPEMGKALSADIARARSTMSSSCSLYAAAASSADDALSPRSSTTCDPTGQNVQTCIEVERGWRRARLRERTRTRPR
eukprot:2832192-Pleurochrysis_carterae.AAC.2